MAIKLIALDLDGTLLTTQKTIDEETKKRLIKAQEMGISITIATGRDKGGIDFVYEPLELEHRGDNFVAGVNGQIIYDFHKKEYYVDKVLDGNDAKKVMALGMKYNFEVISCCGYDFYDLISKRLKAMKRCAVSCLGGRWITGLIRESEISFHWRMQTMKLHRM